MFPVPSHLPRKGSGTVLAPSPETSAPDPPDLVLDLLSTSQASTSTGFSVKQTRDVRIKLEQAVHQNTAKAHQLLIDNFPSISTHIRLGGEVRGDFHLLDDAVRKLERGIDPADQEASFLPPLLTLLSRHFSAVETVSRARAHVDTLIHLSGYLERLEKIEEAVYAGRGADDWVIHELEKGLKALDGQDMLHNTRVMKAADARMKLFRSMVAEQVTDGFAKAISFSTPVDREHGCSLGVQARTSLQRPRIPRPEEAKSPTKASVPPPYSLPHIYHVLSQLGSLPDVLHNLRHRLLRDLILPAVFPSKGQSWRVEESRADSLSILRLEASPQPRLPGDILSGISTILAFIATTVFPPSPTSPPNREAFLSDLQTAALQAFLDHVILPDMPSTMASIHTWLETVHAAMKFEASLIGTNCTKVIVQPFFESAAGPAWAAQRRRRVAEEVRRLILNGWGGWEAVEVEREKEVVMMEEVEMGDAGEENELVDRGGKESDDEMDFGWNFGEEEKERPAEAGTAKLAPDPAMDIEARDDGWQFGDTSNAAGASKPRQSPPAEPNGDGWVFDEVSDPVPKPVALPKPAREAKRLGKKAAKVKTVAEDDVWGSESTSIASSAQQNGHAPAPVQADAWVGWTNDESLKPESDPAIASAPSSVPKAQSAKPRKKAIREVRRTIKETSMISRACEKLLETAERVLREALELQSTELISPSFASAHDILTASANDIFDIYRSLLPTHFAAQLRDVPTLAMQLYNDSLHLSVRISALRDKYHFWETAEDVSRRLIAAGEHAFEAQLVIQRDALMGILDEAGGFGHTGIEGSFRRCERAIRQVKHSIESLARVLKTVLPTTTYISVLGFLLDTAVQWISSDILGLEDITEIESTRLHDLVELLQPLESLFVLQPDQPSTIVAHIPHWLKFCYIAELLQANLVDITYLFDTGALVDFSTAELVGLVRALFADSEKRDAAIERIERGTTGAETTVEAG